MRSTSAAYITNPGAYDKHKARLKLVPCPHCHTVGCLIKHGYLWGKSDKGPDKTRRGWRIFCSNRHHKKGCGRTHSFLDACFLHHRMADAPRLWQLLRGVLAGLSRKAAWEKVAAPFCLETGYRLWQTFIGRQSALRSTLLRALAPPKMRSQNPHLQVIEHLQALFPASACPVADFQLRFQTAFLNPRSIRSAPSG